MSVTLVNVFEVADGRDDEFVRLWQDVTRYVETQPGFVSARLHRTITPESRFRFVNIAEYESAESFKRIAASEEFQRRAGTMRDFMAYRGLYVPVSEHVATPGATSP